MLVTTPLAEELYRSEYSNLSGFFARELRASALLPEVVVYSVDWPNVNSANFKSHFVKKQAVPQENTAK